MQTDGEDSSARPDHRGALQLGSGPRVRTSELSEGLLGRGAWSQRARLRVRLRGGCVCAQGGTVRRPPARSRVRALRGRWAGHGLSGRCGSLGGAHLTAPTPRVGWRAGRRAWALGPLRAAPSSGTTRAGAARPGGGQGGAALPSGPLPERRLGWNRDQPGPGALASAMFSRPTR